MRNGERSTLPIFSPGERLVLASVVLITVAVHLWGWWQSRRATPAPGEPTAPVLSEDASPGAGTMPGVRASSGSAGVAGVPATDERVNGAGGDPLPAQLPAVRAGEATPDTASTGKAGPDAANPGPSPGRLQPSPASPSSYRQPVSAQRQLPSSPSDQPPMAGPNRAGIATGRDAAAALSPSITSRPVSLNQADAAELEALPGIGPALARRIIEYREQHGPFGSVEELQDVPGIGEARLRELRAWVTVP